MDELDEVVREFLIESHDNLDQLDQDFVALEDDPDSTERLASVFRTIHTLKGTAGFFDFHRLERIAHVGENLLSRLRDGELRLDKAMTTALLRMVDTIREILSEIELDGAEPIADDAALLAELERLQSGEHQAPSPPAPGGKEQVQSGPPVPKPVDPGPKPTEARERPRGAQASVTASSVRVSVELLDRLMDLVGELVLSRNQILQRVEPTLDAVLVASSQRLNLVTTDLQQSVMKTRLQPIDTVWSKLPRVVRDLCATCGKRVRLELDGKDTELDRTIIEAIKDPLTHIVRNAIDHGIEPPEVRVAKGKPAEGKLHLQATHEGGQVNIVISDDGAGLDLIRIRDKAIERGLISQGTARRMSDHEAAQLVFRPGFSTAKSITSVSGRGVGMDVVRTKIEEIGGVLDLRTRAGAGTSLKIKIPLTLAIIPALDIRHGDERYAVPQVNVAELVRVPADDVERRIERISGAPVLRLRGRLLPLVFISDLFGIEAPEGDGSRVVIVLNAGSRQFGLVVADVSDTEEIVVKPLRGSLKQLGCYAGATVLGDGNVALILDTLGLAAHAGLLERRDSTQKVPEDQGPGAVIDSSTFLCFSVGNPAPMAIALQDVERLEEVAVDSVERVGQTLVVQHRDGILPLIDLRELFGPASIDDSDATRLQLVITTEGGNPIGLIIAEILDVVTIPISPRGGPSRPGVAATCITDGKVAEIIDLPAVFARWSRPESKELVA